MKKILSLVFTILACVNLQADNLTWSSPPQVISGAEDASDAQVGIDANGNVIAAWIENGVVKASVKEVNQNWKEEVTLSGTGASDIRLVVDPNGNATAIWVENGVINSASKNFDSQWTSLRILSSSGSTSPSIALDAAGNVIAAWATNSNIETATKPFQKSWESPVTISGSSGSSPIIAIGGSKVVIVWQGKVEQTPVVFASIKSASGHWEQPQVISDEGQNAVQPYVAVDANGNATAIWYVYDVVGKSFTNLVVTAADYPASGGGWSCPVSLSAPGIRNPESLVARVAFDSIGNAVALWSISFDDQTFNIESAVKPLNGTWSAPLDLVNSNLYAYVADVSATNFGDVLSLYMFYNGVSLGIQSVESDINGFLNNFWSVPITISLGNYNAYPKVAAYLNNNAINAAAVWLNNNGTNNTVVAVTGSKTLLLPPTNLSVTEDVHDFGVFKEYYYTLSWDASVDPNAAGYLIFRNGLLIGQVDASVLQFIDDNRTPGYSVTYGVSAIDDQQSQSITRTIQYP